MPDDVVLRFSQEGADKVIQSIHALQKASEDLAKSFDRLKGGGAPPVSPVSPDAAKNVGSLISELKALMDTYKGAAASSTTLEGALNTLARAFGAMTSPVGLLVTGLGTAAGAFGAISHHAAETAKEVYSATGAIARSAGITREEAHGLSSTFKLAGSDADILSLAMFRMSNEIDEGGKHLQRWGIEVRNSDGTLKTAAQTFLEFRDRMSIATPMERNSASLDIFGRQARSILPLLSMSKMQFQELSRQAEENSKWTDVLTEKTVAYRYATESLSQKWEGFWLGIASRSIDILTTWAQKAGHLVDLMKEAARIVNLGPMTPQEHEEEKARERIRTRREAMEPPKGKSMVERFWETYISPHLQETEAGRKEWEETKERMAREHARIQGIPYTSEKEVREEVAGGHYEALEERRAAKEPAGTIEAERRLLEIQIRGKYDVIEKQIQADVQYYTQRARLAGESEADIARMEEATLTVRINKENERFAELRSRRDKFDITPQGKEQREREDLEHQEKLMGMQSALQASQLKIIQGTVAAQKKAFEEQVADAKAASDQIITFIEAQKSAQLSVLDIRGETGLGPARQRQEIEETAARQTGMLQRAQVQSQIEAKQQELASAQATGGQLMDLERQLVGEINVLQGQRYNIEVQTNQKILESRKQLFEKTKQLRLEEAEAGSSARSAARAYLAEREGEEPEAPDQLAQLKQQAAQMVQQQGRGGGGRGGRGRRGGRRMTEDEALDALIMQMPETLRPSRTKALPRSKGPLSDQDVENILGEMNRDAQRGMATGSPTEQEERHGNQLLSLMEGIIKRGGGTFAGLSGRFMERMRAALSGDRSFLLGGPGEGPEVDEPGAPPGITARGARPPGVGLGNLNQELGRLAKEADGATDALRGLTPFLGQFAEKLRGLGPSGPQQGPPSPAGTIDFGQGPVLVPGEGNVPRYQEGGEVKETGLALVHKGEFVLPTGRGPVGGDWGGNQPSPSFGGGLVSGFFPEGARRSDYLRTIDAAMDPILAERLRLDPTGRPRAANMENLSRLSMADLTEGSGLRERESHGSYMARMEEAIGRYGAKVTLNEEGRVSGAKYRAGGPLGDSTGAVGQGMVTMSGAGPFGGGWKGDPEGRWRMSAAGPPTLPREMQGITDTAMRTGRVMSMSAAGPPTMASTGGGGAEAVFAGATPQLREAFRRMLAAMRGSGDREAGARALHAETRIDPSSALARSIVQMFMDVLNRERISSVGLGR